MQENEVGDLGAARVTQNLYSIFFHFAVSQLYGTQRSLLQKGRHAARRVPGISDRKISDHPRLIFRHGGIIFGKRRKMHCLQWGSWRARLI